MSGRILDAVTAADTIASAPVTPTANLIYGGTGGYSPQYGMMGDDGKQYEAWLSSAPYIQRNVIPVLMKAPGFFKYMPNSDQYYAILKALIELHPKTISGLQSGLTVEVDETPFGGAGEMLEMFTDVKRARTAINNTYKEKPGKAITKFWDTYIRYGMMDPDTKKPLVSSLITDFDNVGIYTPDFWSFTVLYIQPDITQRYVEDAWLVANQFPKSSGERTGKRDVTTAGEALELSIDFGGLTMVGPNVERLAKTMLDTLTVLDKIPDTDLVLPLSTVDAKVSSNDNIGFNASM